MIRINQIHERSTRRLVVEGSLAGANVDELEKCWLETKAALGDEQLRVDLTAVSYIDDKGRQLLKCMLNEGAELRATGVMTRGILEEIAGNGVR